MKITSHKKQTLLDFLKDSFSDSSNRTLKSWILNRRIKINDTIVMKPQEMVEKGSILSLTHQTKQLYPGLETIFESPDYLILSKPANLLTVPLDNKIEKNVFNILKNSYPKSQILPVHRLDREVSGLILFAKNRQTQLYFKGIFEKREIQKYYIAAVENSFVEKKGIFNSPLTELKSLNVIEDPKGKEAITYYSVINESKNFTTLLLNLKTGRKHQLRVHCASANHPILGDVRYNSKKPFHKRIALHAAYLSFIDPNTKKKKAFFNSPPKEFYLKNQTKLYDLIKEGKIWKTTS